MSKSVVQIVRRFGCVGGMESYVWFLSHELLRLKYKVAIVCEEHDDQFDPDIEVIVIPKSGRKRRWKAMDDFNSQLDGLFNSRPELLQSIIHSHERTGWHHVTTFHGPPMKKRSTLPWYERVSRRLNYWLEAERRELCAPQVQRIVPVSKMICRQLLDQYPECSSRMMDPAYPALSASSPKSFHKHGQPVKLLFAGKEWKRKGLPKAIEICEAIAELCPVELDVFGVSADDLPRGLIRSFVHFHGYQTMVPFDRYDLLIHPAISEPFGMVVIEALSNGCRAMVSNQVGASEKHHDGMIVLDTDAPMSVWVDAALQLLGRVPKQSPEFTTWADLAMYHDLRIYKAVQV